LRYLAPILEKQSYSKTIEKKVLACLNEILFQEIKEILNDFDNEIENSIEEDLTKAIKKGKVQFIEGKFEGSFNSKISRLLREFGAKFSRRTKSWNINLIELPLNIQHAIVSTNIRFKRLYDSILDRISKINPGRVIKTFSFNSEYETVLTSLDKQVHATLKRDIKIIPEFMPEVKSKLAEEYSNNLKLYIKNFTDEQVIKLREEVLSNYEQGYRASALEDVIQHRFNVSKSKARFLAQQETSILTSKVRELRYKDCGITEYIWKTSSDSRVREDHKLLDGTLQEWDNPPITNRKTGVRNHPGEDFGPCRCLAKPVIR